RRAASRCEPGALFGRGRARPGWGFNRRRVDLLRAAGALPRGPRIGRVETPYAGASLPGLLVHPDPEVNGTKAAPAMVFFDGFDVTKELQYGYGVADLAARGVGCLIVDGPGNGESVRFRNLPLIAETQRYPTPPSD